MKGKLVLMYIITRHDIIRQAYGVQCKSQCRRIQIRGGHANYSYILLTPSVLRGFPLTSVKSSGVRQSKICKYVLGTERVNINS